MNLRSSPRPTVTSRGPHRRSVTSSASSSSANSANAPGKSWGPSLTFASSTTRCLTVVPFRSICSMPARICGSRNRNLSDSDGETSHSSKVSPGGTIPSCSTAPNIGIADDKLTYDDAANSVRQEVVMQWTQIYDPFGHWWLSTLVAALPIIVLLGLLAGFRVKPHWCAIAGASTAVAVAILFFRMPPALAALSFGYGVAFGVLKIAWIVLAAVYLYDISVETGQFEIMKESVAGITADRRLQVLLVAFCFGAFIEGAAGFGAPVAIAGAFMIGLGFRPFHAAALNLIANTAPVAWGAIGTPVHTLAAVCGLPESDLNAMIGRILPFTAVIVPFWLVRTMVGWSETFEVLPAILVVGLSFGITQFCWSNYVDSNLVDIMGGVVSIIAVVTFLRFWKPKKIWRFDYDKDATPLSPPTAEITDQFGGEWSAAKFDGYVKVRPYTAGQVLRAWMPFAVLSVFVLLWGLPSIKLAMNRATTPAFRVVLADGKPRPGPPGWDVPYLHGAIYRAAPVVTKPTAEPARYDFNWLSATGTGCFFAAIVSGLLLGLGPVQLMKVFWRTLVRMRLAMIAISFMLGLGYVTRYSGLDAVLGLAFTRTGW